LFGSVNNYFLPVHALLKTQTVYRFIFEGQTKNCERKRRMTRVAGQIKERRTGLETYSFVGLKERKMYRIEHLEKGTLSCEYELLDIHRGPG
jgi:hypothetical protein